MTDQSSTQGDELRQRAISQLRKKRGLQAHILAYVAVNLFLIMIWLLANSGGFFWPVFPLFGWGIGLAFNAWDVYSPDIPTEERIEHEMKRLARR